MSYFPFRGLSAWFSCSVELKFVQQWEDHGGLFADHTCADYLFSDNERTYDTQKVYTGRDEVAVFRSSWIQTVLEQGGPVHDVALGQHLLCPHFLTTPHLTPPQSLAQEQEEESCCYALSVGTMDTHQLWSELERQAKRSRMSEAVHIDSVMTEKKMYLFDCSKPQFIIKRID